MSDGSLTTDAMSGGAGGVVFNDLSRLGGTLDPNTRLRVGTPRRLTDTEISNLIDSSVAGRLMNLMPTWATRAGFIVRFQDVHPGLQDDWDELPIVNVVRSAMSWARESGNAAIFKDVIELDGNTDLSRPLVASQCVMLRGVEVLPKHAMSPASWRTIVGASKNGQRFGDPEVFRVNLTNGGASWSADVHASRLIIFDGTERKAKRTRFDGAWGTASWLQSVWRALATAIRANDAMGHAMDKISRVWVKQNPQSPLMGETGRERLLAKLLDMTLADVHNIIKLEHGEEIGQLAFPISGIHEAFRTIVLWLCAHTGTPVQLFLGDQPGGLGTDGESWRVSWSSDVSATQDREILPALLDMARAHLGFRSGDVTVGFPPVMTLSAAQQAELRSKTLATDISAIDAGLVRQSHVAYYRFGPGARGSFAIDLPPDLDADPEKLVLPPDVRMEAARAMSAGVGGIAGTTRPDVARVLADLVSGAEVSYDISEVAYGAGLRAMSRWAALSGTYDANDTLPLALVGVVGYDGELDSMIMRLYRAMGPGAILHDAPQIVLARTDSATHEQASTARHLLGMLGHHGILRLRTAGVVIHGEAVALRLSDPGTSLASLAADSAKLVPYPGSAPEFVVVIGYLPSDPIIRETAAAGVMMVAELMTCPDIVVPMVRLVHGTATLASVALVGAR